MEHKTTIYQNIITDLSDLSENKLEKVHTFIKFLLYKNKETDKKKEPKTLNGIWKNIGFEKILDINAEIKTLRKETSDNILNRTFE
ncbi:MAG: DUF2281 domain-containing protein [Bacteroidales bacterium]|nr:DUF2281 domain-containing protein [Bacteroidales bacterium]